MGSDAFLPRTLTAIAAPLIVSVRAHATGTSVGVGAGVGVELVVEVGMAVCVAAGLPADELTAGIQMLAGVPDAAAWVVAVIGRPHAAVNSPPAEHRATMARRNRRFADGVFKMSSCGVRRRPVAQR